ncbi:MAG: hypothetical protein NXI20_12725 [bacterium]|nr:hypothetical protein [bacterium]
MQYLSNIFKYTYNRVANRYQIVFREDYNSWIVMRDSKIYYMDTKKKCYEFLCAA